MTRLTGGGALARALGALGVSEVFALHGGHLDAFLVACAGEGIRLTDTRHEATAGHAAQGYARATGSPGVCVITAGPGFTNALTAMTDAWLDASPVVFIAGSPPLREAETNPLQGGFDQVAMAAPVTKWSHRVTNAERVADLTARALRLAASGRPGPVFLEIPIDVMFAPVDAAHAHPPPRPTFDDRPAPSAPAAARLVELVLSAERPALICGGGAANRRTAALAAAFAERFAVPVLASSKGLGILPSDHPMNAGGAANLGLFAMASGQTADLVILLGAREGLFLGGRGPGVIPADARIVQADVSGAEIGRLRTPDLALAADAGEVLAAALALAPATAPAGRGAWISGLAGVAREGRTRFLDAPAHAASGLIHPAHAAHAVAEALAPDTAIAYDGGEACAWFHPFARPAGPGLYMGNGYLGCLGVGQGYAIGLARARPGAPVAVIMGDGAAGFHIAEFDTMARHGLPITTVVFNNACWGMSRHGQEIVFGRQNLAAVNLSAAEYDVVARGFGCAGERVERLEDIAPAIRRAQARPGPSCVNILTDPEIVHPVTPMMIGETDTETEIAIPYYENIPIRP